ncbi:MAG TPA: hypothetical protein DCM23_01620 [Firmicutes bacterium]|nr:hypothetical protein [Bacillota bacterium]HAV20298.1 hypothetical protein [Bacillota bacterium]
MYFFTSNLDSAVPYLLIGVAVISVIILGLLVYIAILQFIVSGYFSSKKFAIKSKHKVEPLTGNEKFELMVFNNNVNEARVLSFGFLYRSNSVDFFDTYLSDANLKKDAKVVIMSRDFIKLEIEAKHLQQLIESHNNGRVRVEPIYAYVTDISGHIIKYPAREVRRIIYRHFKAIDDVKKAKEKVERQEKSRIKREAFMAKFKRQPKAEKQIVKEVKPVEPKKEETPKVEKAE